MYIKFNNGVIKGHEWFRYDTSKDHWVTVNIYGEDTGTCICNKYVGESIGKGEAKIVENPTFVERIVYPIIKRDISIDGWYWYIFKNFSVSWCKEYGFRLANQSRDYSKDTSLVDCSAEELTEAIFVLCGATYDDILNK